MADALVEMGRDGGVAVMCKFVETAEGEFAMCVQETGTSDMADVVDKLTSILASVDGLEGYTNDIETILASCQTLLTTINTTITTVDGHIDQLEGYTDGIEALLTAISAKLQPIAGALGSNVVGTSILRVLGASSWTGATTNGATPRKCLVTNCSPAQHLYLVTVAVGASLTGVVTSSVFEADLLPGETRVFSLPANVDLACVKTVADGYVAYAREVLL